MARAKRHYVPGQVWPITQSCHKREFLLKFKHDRHRWTESIAVGSSPFIERIKNAMGVMARGRSVHPGEGAFELRKAQSAYNSIFDPKKLRYRPKICHG